MPGRDPEVNYSGLPGFSKDGGDGGNRSAQVVFGSPEFAEKMYHFAYDRMMWHKEHARLWEIQLVYLRWKMKQ